MQPAYYAAIIAAEATGKSSSTRIAEIEVDHERVAGYAFYDGNGELVRAVFINSDAYLKDEELDSRPSVHVTLDFASKDLKMRIKRLAIAFADDDKGVQWGGQTYETEDGRVQGQLQEEEVDVVNGVDIAATEVVLLTFL